MDLFSQGPLSTHCACLQAHNEQRGAEKAPGRRCSSGTGSEGATMNPLFCKQNDRESNYHLGPAPFVLEQNRTDMRIIHSREGNYYNFKINNAYVQPWYFIGEDR